MEDIRQFLNYSYKEYVDYLLKKYGAATHPYFCNESLKSRNTKISRVNEGLFCHHIDEDKFILLSNSEYAKLAPWECQLPDRLVYCNIIEHLLLHIKIFLESNGEMSWGGAETVLRDAVQLVSLENVSGDTWKAKCAKVVKNDYKNLGEVVWYAYEKGVYKDLRNACLYMQGSKVKFNDNLFWYLVGKKNNSDFHGKRDKKVKSNLLEYKVRVKEEEKKKSTKSKWGSKKINEHKV